MAAAVFFYDLGDPECYLAAERINPALAVVPEWEPVLGAQVCGAPAPVVDPESIARRASALGLQRLRWPAHWPPDTRTAMLAATFAKRSGRGVAFSLAAFRQAFAGGRDLSELDTVLISAAACELHPVAVVKAVALRSIATELEAAGARAQAAGVRELPAIAIGGEVLSGADAVERAGAALDRAA